jgi:hypothetical protein
MNGQELERLNNEKERSERRIQVFSAIAVAHHRGGDF